MLHLGAEVRVRKVGEDVDAEVGIVVDVHVIEADVLFTLNRGQLFAENRQELGVRDFTCILAENDRPLLEGDLELLGEGMGGRF